MISHILSLSLPGLKEAEEEVEKFVQSNTQEVAKDKWQCPLCGKKFKGAEYVHKHILMKHAEKVKEVKKEVCFVGGGVFWVWIECVCAFWV